MNDTIQNEENNPSFLNQLLCDWKNGNFQEYHPRGLSERILLLTESILGSGLISRIRKEVWSDFLDITGKHDFLEALNSRELRHRWTETVFQIIRHIDYRLSDMFLQRVQSFSNHVLFREVFDETSTSWTYEQINRHVRDIATVFYTSVQEPPRVAIFSDNSIESACCDLACLFYDILDTPLNVYFDAQVITHIFDKLSINIAVTNSMERLKVLKDVRSQTKKPFCIFITEDLDYEETENIQFLAKSCKRINASIANETLDKRKRRDLNQVTTVMFTSGSTGSPKGVCFSMYNLVTKRFARAAALPKVGNQEILLCYLPLYHTFGRYLELLGTIYWGGTYTFTGNPSAETLLSLFPRINPTGFISIPLRWSQLHERCLESMDPIPDEKLRDFALRSVIGNRLRWGLSAAGYLDPKVFRFFQNHDIALCSGFGMTEATGGITMTPPDRYVEYSHGIPLPGVHVRLGEKNELQVRGPYIAMYLDEIGPDGYIPYPESVETDYWLLTGDLFQVSGDGFYQIVDRIKDIYKNDRGQTIAPRKVETKFINVPGIKRTFLVGDGHPYNVLFIIPDKEDPVLSGAITEEQKREYYHQIVAAANQDLAPYERIINFSVLSRDFDVSRKELTPKGSYNRKQIELDFSEQIDELYRSNYMELILNGLTICIPRWFYRNLGILEDDIEVDGSILKNRITGAILAVVPLDDLSHYRIGDLEYILKDDRLDMGLFSRQPKLWLGNAALVAFCPIRIGWDIPFDTVSDHLFRPWNHIPSMLQKSLSESNGKIRNQELLKLHHLTTHMIFGNGEEALNAVRESEKLLKTTDSRSAELIRLRLETLARHPEEAVRCMAYKILLVDEPQINYSKAFPAFINSGLTFLNQESIREIAFSMLEKRRLDALRRRLFTYRLQLSWPVDKSIRNQFVSIFKLLVSFVAYHPEFYNSVRAELASWILHTDDPELSKSADKLFTKLFTDFESKLEMETSAQSKSDWLKRLVFDDGLSPNEINRIKKVLIGTSFLKQSIMLAFDEHDFDLNQVEENGIWISRLQSSHYYLLYRMSINTKNGKHFDLQLVLREILQDTEVRKAVHWLEAVAGYPFGPPVLPPLGCYRPELGARSMVYLNEITVWEKIRQLSGIQFTGGPFSKPRAWEKLFITALSVFYRGWRNSGTRIVPGSVSPTNVVVPELDFRESAKILSLVGWQNYRNTMSLIQPMVQNFYAKITANFPWIKEQLNISWIFDACIEALGEESAFAFLNQLKEDLAVNKLQFFDQRDFTSRLESYLGTYEKTYYMPLALKNAVGRFADWEALNPMGTRTAKEQTVVEVYHLYRLDRYEEIARYVLYRHTYFAQADQKILDVFDSLIAAMSVNRQKPAIQLLELSDLQAVLNHPDDRNVFSRMVFPQFRRRPRLEVLKIGESEQEHVIVHSTIMDKYGVHYIVRAPVSPAEIGQLYRLFFNENYPKQISEHDKHFVVLDANERVVGGICYQIQENNVAEIEGVVVTSPLKERGLGTAIIEDFNDRMTSEDIHVIKAHFFLNPFYEKLGFHVDKSWGALVKFIKSEENLKKKLEADIGEESMTEKKDNSPG